MYVNIKFTCVKVIDKSPPTTGFDFVFISMLTSRLYRSASKF